jgi:hypothetical protein
MNQTFAISKEFYENAAIAFGFIVIGFFVFRTKRINYLSCCVASFHAIMEQIERCENPDKLIVLSDAIDEFYNEYYLHIDKGDLRSFADDLYQALERRQEQLYYLG